MKNLLILFSLIFLLSQEIQIIVAGPPPASSAPTSSMGGCPGVARVKPLTFKGKFTGRRREDALKRMGKFLERRSRELPLSFDRVATIKEASILGLRLFKGGVERFFPIMCGQLYDPIVRRSAQHKLNYLRHIEQNWETLIRQEMVWHVQHFNRTMRLVLKTVEVKDQNVEKLVERWRPDERWKHIPFIQLHPEETQSVRENKPKINPVKDPEAFCVAVAMEIIGDVAGIYKAQNRRKLEQVLKEIGDAWSDNPRMQEFQFDLLDDTFGLLAPDLVIDDSMATLGRRNHYLISDLNRDVATPLIVRLQKALQEIAERVGQPELLESGNFTRENITETVEPLHDWLAVEANQIDLQTTLGYGPWFTEFLLEVLSKKGKSRRKKNGEVIPARLNYAAHLSSTIDALRERDRLARGEFESPDNSMWSYFNDRSSLGLQFGNEFRSTFFRNLGTSVLSHFSGLFPHKDGINLLLVHGSGTTNSSAQSWKALIMGFTSAFSNMKTAVTDGIGFNPMAPDFAFAGVGPVVKRPYQVLAFMDRTIHSLRAMAKRSGVDQNPFVYFGRSSGALYALSHALFFQGPRNLIDAYIGMSFSHPETIEKQIANIHEQRDKGYFSNVDNQSLSWFQRVSDKTLERLRQLKKEKAAKLATLGDHILFFQGDSDEDGNISRDITAISGLRDLRDQFVPLVHVYEFYNPLQNHPIFKIGLKEGLITPYSFEATHFLLSTNPNMKRDAWRRIEKTFLEAWTKKFPDKDPPELPEVSDADLPALMDQFTEMIAAMFGFFDYLAENNSPFPEMVRAKEVFSAYKIKILGSEQAAKTTYFDWYRDQIIVRGAAMGRKKNPDVERYKDLQNNPENWRNIDPNPRGLLGRLKRVEDYWLTERVRIKAIRGEP